MIVTAVIGSCRRGQTLETVKLFEQKLKIYDGIDFRYIFLKDSDLQTCRGCGLCIERGEEFCPLKDDRDKILAQMLESDGVIFASPNYAMQVPAISKNLLDRLAFVLHRPLFFNRVFMPIVTQGFYGNKPILNYLASVGRFWGFRVSPGLSITTDWKQPVSELPNIDAKLENKAKLFYRELTRRANVPNLIDLLIFRLNRSGKPFVKETMPRDYQYFKERGWLESDYFYKVELNMIYWILGSLVDKWSSFQGIRNKNRRVNK